MSSHGIHSECNGSKIASSTRTKQQNETTTGGPFWYSNPRFRVCETIRVTTVLSETTRHEEQSISGHWQKED